MNIEQRLLTPWRTPHSPEGLEQELRRELVPTHDLYSKSAKALAVTCDRDDVLLEISDGTETCYAVVHLTWSGLAEYKNCPFTEVFESLEQWIEWMKADHQDYSRS